MNMEMHKYFLERDNNDCMTFCSSSMVYANVKPRSNHYLTLTLPLIIRKVEKLSNPKPAKSTFDEN